MKNNKVPSVIGAALGFALFLVVGLMPTLVYGGYAGLLLAGGIFGTPVPTTLLPRALVMFGMGLGVTGVAFFFTVGGAVAGTLAGAIAQKVSPKAVVAQPQPSTNR